MPPLWFWFSKVKESVLNKAFRKTKHLNLPKERSAGESYTSYTSSEVSVDDVRAKIKAQKRNRQFVDDKSTSDDFDLEEKGETRSVTVSTLSERCEPKPNLIVCNHLLADMEMNLSQHDYEVENEDDIEMNHDKKTDHHQLLKRLDRGNGDIDVQETLRTNPNFFWESINDPDTGDTLIHLLARSGNTAVLIQLHQYYLNFNSKDPEKASAYKSPFLLENKDGDTVLHLALQQSHKDTAFDLIKEEPDVAFAVNKAGLTPFYMAVKAGYKDLVESILQKAPWRLLPDSEKRRLLDSTSPSFLQEAIKARELGMMDILFNGIPGLMTITDRKGWRPLSYAAYYGYIDVVSYFVQKCPCSVKNCDEDGSYPIHKAVAGGQLNVVSLLVSSFPETMKQVDNRKQSILHFAVKYLRADLLTFLVGKHEMKQMFDQRDCNGDTFADLAKQLQSA